MPEHIHRGTAPTNGAVPSFLRRQFYDGWRLITLLVAALLLGQAAGAREQPRPPRPLQ